MPGNAIPHADKSVAVHRDSVDLDSVAGKSTASDLDCFHAISIVGCFSDGCAGVVPIFLRTDLVRS